MRDRQWGIRGKLALVVTLCVLSGMARAQSSMTLYGLADAFAGEVRAAGAKGNAWQVGSGGMTTSYWGLSGTEDLGNGLKAIFTSRIFFASPAASRVRSTASRSLGATRSLALAAISGK